MKAFYIVDKTNYVETRCVDADGDDKLVAISRDIISAWSAAANAAAILNAHAQYTVLPAQLKLYAARGASPACYLVK